MFRILMLPAGRGDALWLEYGDADDPHRMLIDGGYGSTMEGQRERITALAGEGRVHLELLVVTHVDTDHIGGALEILGEKATYKLDFDEVWFNRWNDLPDTNETREAWAERLDIPDDMLGGHHGALLDELLAARVPWAQVNARFDHGPVFVGDEAMPPRVELDSGMVLTVVSPSFTKLRRLTSQWNKEDTAARRTALLGDFVDDDVADMLGGHKPEGEVPVDLAGLLVDETKDGSRPNGSSIAFIAEFGGRKVLLTGDAHSDVLRDSLKKLAGDAGRVKLDAVKMPHHGSTNNTADSWLKYVDCDVFLFSTDGGGPHYHPDREAVARVLGGDWRPRPWRQLELVFNYRSETTEVWDRDELRARWAYRPHYPTGAVTTDSPGITLDVEKIEPRDPNEGAQPPAHDGDADEEVPFIAPVGGGSDVLGSSRALAGDFLGVVDDDGRLTPFQAIDESEMVEASFLRRGSDLARCVVKLDAGGVDYKGRRRVWSGTGFFVSPDVLLTNHHVINSPEVARNSQVTLDYETDERGVLRETSTLSLRPERLFVTSPTKGGLDFTFVGVDRAPDDRGFVPLSRDAGLAIDRTRANIVQHPRGETKKVTLQANRISKQTETVVHYSADTLKGSSGAPVWNNNWELIALHHATKESGDRHVNEGIKPSAIAALLERWAGQGNDHARRALQAFGGTDELMGFFGALGRAGDDDDDDGVEAVVTTYEGEAGDLDVGFWNIEWFNKHWEDKLEEVAALIRRMNLDVWVLVESSPESARALAAHLTDTGVDFAALASEPDASPGKQTTTVLYNRRTCDVERREWPEAVREWFSVDSRDFDDLDLEAEHGKVFNRYPALFRVTAAVEGDEEGLRFNLVPVHLKAKAEGSLRRRMAAQLLSEAIAKLKDDEDFEGEWMIGGDYNAELKSKDFDHLRDSGMVPLTAADEADGQLTYLKGRFKSLIDHIFVSPNLAQVAGDEAIIVAADRTMDDFLRLSDHRPLLARLSLAGTPAYEKTNLDLTAIEDRLKQR